MEDYYTGDLCDIMAYYETYRCFLILSYILAVSLKLYNTYFYHYLSIHIEAR